MSEGGERGGQDLLVCRETGPAFWCVGKRTQEPASVGTDRWNQTSRSRKNSDSSPSFAFVDSNKSVEGGRRPE